MVLAARTAGMPQNSTSLKNSLTTTSTTKYSNSQDSVFLSKRLLSNLDYQTNELLGISKSDDRNLRKARTKSQIFNSNYIVQDLNQTKSTSSITNSDDSESFEICLMDTHLNCMRPYKLNHNNTDFQNKLQFLSDLDLNSNKLYCRRELLFSDLRVNQIENNEEFSVTRYIERTVMGWEEKGLHYWLHKLNMSNLILPVLEEISGTDSWFQIHFCENCTELLKASKNIIYVKHKFLNKNENIFYRYLFNRGEKGFNEMKDNSQLLNYYKHSDSNAYREETCLFELIKCNRKYFSSLVYNCYSAYDLNFLWLNKHRKVKGLKQKEDPALNPFVKVVVYGTDPCGLNFPLDLEPGPTSNQSTYTKLTVDERSAMPYLSQNNFTTKPLSRVNTKLQKTEPLQTENLKYNFKNNSKTDVFCWSLKKRLSVTSVEERINQNDHDFRQPYLEKNSFNESDINCNLALIDQSDLCKSRSVCELSGGITESLIGSDNYGLMERESKELFDQSQCPSNSDDKSSYMLGDNFFRYAFTINKSHLLETKSHSDSDFNSKTSYSKLLRLSPSVKPIQSSCSDILVCLNNITSSRTIYRAAFPRAGTVLEFSVRNSKQNVGKLKSSKSLGHKIKKKKKKSPFFIHFPDSSSMRVRLVNLTGKNKHPCQDGKNDFIDSQRESKLMKGVHLRKSQCSLLIIVCLSIFVFCILSYFIDNDLFISKPLPPPPPKDKPWFNFF